MEGKKEVIEGISQLFRYNMSCYIRKSILIIEILLSFVTSHDTESQRSTGARHPIHNADKLWRTRFISIQSNDVQNNAKIFFGYFRRTAWG